MKIFFQLKIEVGISKSNTVMRYRWKENILGCLTISCISAQDFYRLTGFPRNVGMRLYNCELYRGRGGVTWTVYSGCAASLTHTQICLRNPARQTPQCDQNQNWLSVPDRLPCTLDVVRGVMLMDWSCLAVKLSWWHTDSWSPDPGCTLLPQVELIRSCRHTVQFWIQGK